MPEKILIAINGTLNYCRLKLYLLSVLAKLRFIFEVTNKMFKIFKKIFQNSICGRCHGVCRWNMADCTGYIMKAVHRHGSWSVMMHRLRYPRHLCLCRLY